MDLSGISSSLQAALSMTVLNMAMGKTADVVENLIQDMQPAAPAAVLAPKAGGMDILV